MRRMTVNDFLYMSGDRAKLLLGFHKQFHNLFNKAKGSSHNHQAWKGGYADHLNDCTSIAFSMYSVFKYKDQREMPFDWESVFIVLYFHDIEKMWKYTVGLPEDWNKDLFLWNELPQRYGIKLTDQELDAIKYIHGEGSDYSGTHRVMNELAAFCHAADVLSARLWHGMSECPS